MKFIVSMTVIDSRIDNIKKVVNFLLNENTLTPEKIYIYVSKDPFFLDNGISPNKLPKFSDDRVEYKYVDNVGSMRKYVYIAKEHWEEKDMVILTLDDDIKLHKKSIEDLLMRIDDETAVSLAGGILTKRGVNYRKGRNKVKCYEIKKEREVDILAPGVCMFKVGHLHEDILQWEQYEDLGIKYSEQMFFNYLLDKAGTKKVVIPSYKWKYYPKETRKCISRSKEAIDYKTKQFNEFYKKNMIIIDCGAYVGIETQELMRKYPNHTKVYAFEVDERALKKLEKIEDINIIKKAVWIKDEKRKYYIAKEQGSTLYKSKITNRVNENNFKIVESIDFPNWIKKNFNKADYLIVNMDMEGAEYRVLLNLIKSGIINMIDELNVEFHYKKIRTIKQRTHNRVIRILKRLKGENFTWRISN